MKMNKSVVIDSMSVSFEKKIGGGGGQFMSSMSYIGQSVYPSKMKITGVPPEGGRKRSQPTMVEPCPTDAGTKEKKSVCTVVDRRGSQTS